MLVGVRNTGRQGKRVYLRPPFDSDLDCPLATHMVQFPRFQHRRKYNGCGIFCTYSLEVGVACCVLR
jgi:hypothetical protein